MCIRDRLMVPWVKHSEPLRQNWYAYLTQPDLPSLLQQKWKFVTKEPIDQVYAVLGYFRAKVQMLELETLGNQNVIYIHIGVNCTTDLRDEEEFAPWEIRALRLLGSQARIKLLKAIHAQPMSTRELADVYKRQPITSPSTQVLLTIPWHSKHPTPTKPYRITICGMQIKSRRF